MSKESDSMDQFSEVPTVDLAPVRRALASGIGISADPQAVAVATKVAAAAAEWGFFQCVGHGGGEKVIEDFDTAMVAFFAMETTKKDTIRRTVDNSRGYFDDELTKQTRDWKECFDVGQSWASEIDGSNRWPQLPGFREAIEKYYTACLEISEILLRICAVGLGLPESYFDSEMKCSEGHTSFLRLNHYPVCTTPVQDDWGTDEPSKDAGYLGINKHSDAGCITVLRQYADQPASLQVLHHGRWRRVVPQPGAFTINIGDMMQVISNDRYVAPVHRVLATPAAERYSAPFFFNPPYELKIVPVPTAGPPRYTPFTWGEFRRRRFEGDFSDTGTEVQISDWSRIHPSPMSRL